MSVNETASLDEIQSAEASEPIHTATPHEQYMASMVSTMQNGIEKTNALISRLVESIEGNSISCSQHAPKRALEIEPVEDGDESATKRAKRAPKSGQQSNENDHNVNTQNAINDDVLSLFGGSEGEYDHDGGEGEAEISDLDNEDDLLSSISQDLFETTDKGPAISEKLAKITDKNFIVELEPGKLKNILQKHPRPQNCEQLYVPKVNPEIWYKMPGYTRKKDIKLANLQDTLQTSVSAIMSSLNDIMQSHEMKRQTDLKMVVSKLVDATALIGHVSKELSFKRRDSIKPFLHNDFKQACSRDNKVESLLFGTDLPATAQKIKNTSKVMQSVTVSNNRFNNNNVHRFNTNNGSSSQYNSGNTQSHSQPRFLSQRGRKPYPPRRPAPYITQYKKKFQKN
ncbi:uncharacterized protein LOC114515588 [Dendronephthya gigantea]|uniref:uncharacterized protein LOC114515588 n=1 Tax=Dendronephthya gigantea TaxID=151771 RepID=UPI0010694225|nr:uncharacterized protein LOC114515588 [Dendronephthya gigantea]